MKGITLLLILFGAAIIGLSCSTRSVPWRHRNSDFLRSESDLDGLRKRALAGDASAAYDIALHFELGRSMREAAIEWFRISSLLGDERAQKVLQLKLKHER